MIKATVIDIRVCC